MSTCDTYRLGISWHVISSKFTLRILHDKWGLYLLSWMYLHDSSKFLHVNKQVDKVGNQLYLSKSIPNVSFNFILSQNICQ